MARRTRQHYISADELRDALLESQQAGEPTVRLCNLLRLLITHFLTGPRWCGYDRATREDMASAALIKCLKNIKNFSPDKGRSFSYMSLVIQTSCSDFLARYYKNCNMIQEVRSLDRDEWLGSVPQYVRVDFPQRRPPQKSGLGEVGKTPRAGSVAQPETND